MPNEPIQDTSLLLSAEAANARTAQAREAQSALKARESITSPGSTYKGVPNEDAENALAQSFKEVTGTPAPREGDEVPTERQVTPAPGVPADPARPVVPVKPKEKTPAGAEEEKRAQEEKTRSETKDTLDDLLATAREKPEEKPEEIPEKASDQPYAEHQISESASKKSKEAFENLRKAAVERETTQKTRADAAEARLVQLEAELKDAKSKVGAIPQEVETELKELREHRALFDVEADPAFRQKYESQANQHYEAIYQRLRVHSYPDSEIEELRKLPKAVRDAEIDRLTGLLEKPEERRPIEARMAKIEGIEEDRQAELAQTRAKAEQIVKAQREASKVQTAVKIDEIANLVKPKLQGLDWFFPKDIPPGTPPELVKKLEAHNAFAAEIQEQLRSAIVNDDVQTRATAALSVPLSRFLARELRVTKAALAAATERLEKINKAGNTSRLNERSTVKADIPAAVTVDSDPQEAIDSLFRQARGSVR